MSIVNRYILFLLTVTLLVLSSSPIFAEPTSGNKFSQSGHMKEGSGAKELSQQINHHGKAEGSKKNYSGHYRKSGHGEYGKKVHGYGKRSHHAKSGHGHHRSGPFKHILQFKNELGLTEDQIVFIKEKKFEYEKTKIKLDAEHKVSHLELDRALHAEKIDENKINQIVDEIVAQKTNGMRARIEGKLGVLRKLTDQQRKLINKMYNEHN